MPGSVKCTQQCTCRKHDLEVHQRISRARLGSKGSSTQAREASLARWAKPDANNGCLGSKRSLETRKRMSKSQKAYCSLPEAKKRKGEEMARRHAAGLIKTGHSFATRPEQIMAAILEFAGVEFESHKRFGRYVPDFYMPKSNTVLEVDGVYWHKDTARDAARDVELLTEHGIQHVTHITDTQLRERGWL